MTERRTLAEHVGEALLAAAYRVMTSEPFAALPDKAAARAAAVQWADQAFRRLTVEVVADATRSGRPDTRSGRAIVRYWDSTGRSAVLCDPLLRHLVDANGEPVDARAVVRDLLAQAKRVTDEDLARLIDEERGRQ
ncbi:MAG: hypothetical protein ABS81_14615 [Pseudonocardia sp. SCN 72-86]|nr:MAG: hypothetical protein ABS81_14615 [Pseudonocardia sp. SCN 72-86]